MRYILAMGIEQRVTRLEYLVELICCFVCRSEWCPRRGSRHIEDTLGKRETPQEAEARPDPSPAAEVPKIK
jgi:hypothetical protein